MKIEPDWALFSFLVCFCMKKKRKDLCALDGYDFQQGKHNCYAEQVSLVASVIWFSRNGSLFLPIDLAWIDLLLLLFAHFPFTVHEGLKASLGLYFFSCVFSACLNFFLAVYYVIKCLLKRNSGRWYLCHS